MHKRKTNLTLTFPKSSPLSIFSAMTRSTTVTMGQGRQNVWMNSILYLPNHILDGQSVIMIKINFINHILAGQALPWGGKAREDSFTPGETDENLIWDNLTHFQPWESLFVKIDCLVSEDLLKHDKTLLYIYILLWFPFDSWNDSHVCTWVYEVQILRYNLQVRFVLSSQYKN